MACPKGLEPPFSGIGIRCVIQLRHGQIYFIFYYTMFLLKNQSVNLKGRTQVRPYNVTVYLSSICQFLPDFILGFLLSL